MIKIILPKNCINELMITLRNLAVLFQSDLCVLGKTARDSVSLSFNSNEIKIPAPDLEAWKNKPLRTAQWRGIPLPQIHDVDGQYPDLLGLAFYLFHDIEEIKQEVAFPGERYDIRKSAFREVYPTNYLDCLIAEIKKDLGMSASITYGVILTHDLDFLSIRDVIRLDLCWKQMVATTQKHNLGLLLGSMKALFRAFASPTRFFEEFEFLKWAKAEKESGYNSIFFVFAHERRHTFEGDAWYHFGYRNRRIPLTTLRQSLKKLFKRGFLIGLHLSRSSNYLKEEISRELESIKKELGIKVNCIRNHWLWLQYSNWHDYLLTLGIEFDFNIAAVGYAKGTSYPYWAKNNFTMIFPTTYMDDAVLKEKNMFLTREQALGLLNAQLDQIIQYGGCIAISFHPAEDGPSGIYRIQNKLDFYKEVLNVLLQRDIPVYLPQEAREKFHKYRLLDMTRS